MTEKDLKIKPLVFNDSEYICELLIENLQISWEDDEKANLEAEKSTQFDNFTSGKKDQFREKNSYHLGSSKAK